MNQLVLKIAASGLVIGTTMVGCNPGASHYRPQSVAAAPAPALAPVQDDAAAFAARADAAMRRGDHAGALAFAEQAVTLAPQDASYRMALAGLYVRNGRFASAETTYGDVVALAPDHHRAALGRVLAQIAQGRNASALDAIDRLSGVAPASDVGLAYALAGQPARGVALLEPAARAFDADARVRQNLALAYALSGDWQKARTVAAQDVSPAEIGQRMQQWAAFASPSSSYDQVAGLLGVTPAADPGQPVRLALADVGPAYAETAPPQGPAPAESATGYGAAPTRAVVDEFGDAPAMVRYAAAVESLVDAAPPPAAPISSFNSMKKKPRVGGHVAPRRASDGAGSRFVVQLGAYGDAAAVERAWSQVELRYGLNEAGEPLSTTVSIPGRGTFHRLSISGFEDRGEASRMCASIRAKGGACFVRLNAGDAPVRFAGRQSRRA